MRMNHALPLLAGLALIGCGDATDETDAGADSGSVAAADSDGDGTITQAEAAQELASGAAISMQPGQWRQTIDFTDFDLPGVPEGMRDMVRSRMNSGITSTQCLSERDVAQPDADFFGGEGQDNCSYDEFERSGNRMTMKMTCANPGGGSTVVEMSGRFGDGSYTMDISSRVSGTPMGAMSMSGTVTGERIGDC